VAWEFTSDRPIYRQLLEQITLKIIVGEYAPGERLASVRELAQEASVNPNTMQKALAELEEGGLLFSQRTAGRFITEDKDMIKKAKDSLAMQQAVAFLERMKSLGFDRRQIIALLEKIDKEEQGYDTDSGNERA